MSEEKYYGKYRGRVIDDSDPLLHGRLRVQVFDVAGEEHTGWAMPCVPDPPGRRAIPPVGNNVWVEFEAGDLSQAIWSGVWWDPGTPPE